MSYKTIAIGTLFFGLLAVQTGISRADDEKPVKDKPAKATKETPAKEPPAKEKPEVEKKAPETPPKKKPAPETPAVKKPAKERSETEKKAKLAGKEMTPVEAIVKSVVPEKNAITVVLRADEGKAEQTFIVEKDARYMVAGNKTATLAEVKPEMHVALFLTAQKTVIGIKAGEGGNKGEKPKGQPGEGIVKSVNAEKNEITITIKKDGEPSDQSFGVAKDARIFAGSGDGSLGDIKAGARVGFLLSENGKTIQVIKAGPAGEKGSIKKKGEK